MDHAAWYGISCNAIKVKGIPRPNTYYQAVFYSLAFYPKANISRLRDYVLLMMSSSELRVGTYMYHTCCFPSFIAALPRHDSCLPLAFVKRLMLSILMICR